MSLVNFNMPTKEQVKIFIQNPFPVFAIVLTAAVVYLFYDNKNLHDKIEHYHEGDQATMIQVIQQNTEALKANTEFFKSLNK